MATSSRTCWPEARPKPGFFPDLPAIESPSAKPGFSQQQTTAEVHEFCIAAILATCIPACGFAAVRTAKPGIWDRRPGW
jgi:hypothetical protein